MLSVERRIQPRRRLSVLFEPGPPPLELTTVGLISRNSTMAIEALSVVLLLARRRISVTIRRETMAAKEVGSQKRSKMSSCVVVVELLLVNI